MYKVRRKEIIQDDQSFYLAVRWYAQGTQEMERLKRSTHFYLGNFKVNVRMKNPGESADIWIVDLWIVGLELRKGSCLDIWSSSSRKGSLKEDALMVRHLTIIIIELMDN